MGVFYTDYGLIVSRAPEWIQGAVNVLIGLFRRVVLMDNVAKSKTMYFHPGEICTGMSEETFSGRSKGEEATYRERLWRRIPCP